MVADATLGDAGVTMILLALSALTVNVLDPVVTPSVAVIVAVPAV